jgi:hypothetical protein
VHVDEILFMWWNIYHGSQNDEVPGADTGFQGRGGAHLKQIAPSGGKRENVWGNSFEKSRFYAKKSYFFRFYGGRT